MADEFDIDLFGEATPPAKGKAKKRDVEDKTKHELEKAGFKGFLKETLAHLNENKDLVFFVLVELALTVVFILIVIGILPPF